MPHLLGGLHLPTGPALLVQVGGPQSRKLNRLIFPRDEAVGRSRRIAPPRQRLGPPNDRARLEQLCRYLLRPQLVQDRVHRRADGRVLVALKTVWRDGTSHLLFEPIEVVPFSTLPPTAGAALRCPPLDHYPTPAQDTLGQRAIAMPNPHLRPLEAPVASPPPGSRGSPDLVGPPPAPAEVALVVPMRWRVGGIDASSLLPPGRRRPCRGGGGTRRRGTRGRAEARRGTIGARCAAPPRHHPPCRR